MAGRRAPARRGAVRPPAPPARWPCARDRSAARAQPRSVAAHDAVAGKLEALLRPPATPGAEDPAVRGLLGDEGVLHAVALTALIDADAARDDLKQPSAARRPYASVRKRDGPSLRRTQRGWNTVRRSPLQRDFQPPGSVAPQTAVLLKSTRSGSAGSNWVIALWMPKAGRARNTPPTSSAVAHSSYERPQPGHRQEAPRLAALDPRAVGNGLAEVGHLARSRQHSAAALAEQPGLERVETEAAAPRRTGSLVQNDHPREALAVLVRHEDLEAGVRLRAARVVAHKPESRHPRAAEEPEGTRV